MKELLFSYGTLQYEKVQLQLFGRLLHGTKDMLEGFRLSSIEIKDETFLSKGEEKQQQTLIATNDQADRTEGMVFEISAEELLRADQYEPVNYRRIQVLLLSDKKAWVYMAV